MSRASDSTINIWSFFVIFLAHLVVFLIFLQCFRYSGKLWSLFGHFLISFLKPCLGRFLVFVWLCSLFSFLLEALKLSYTEMFSAVFKHSCSYARMFLQTLSSTRSRVCTKTVLYKDAFKHRRFHTQALSRTASFRKSRFHMHLCLHTDAVTHSRSCTESN